MNQIDQDFVYNKYPKTEHDVQILDNYKSSLKDINSLEGPQLLFYFPVDESCGANTKDVQRLTRFGFMALSIDNEYMNHHYRNWCRYFLNTDLSNILCSDESIKLLRASLIEFAILGCIEAQQLMSKLDLLYGKDDAFVESIVNKRCPNLSRFLNAHSGSGWGVNPDDEVSTYEQALKEVRSGCKTSHWIWYVFPQMAGIKGTHSRPALFYGINGRLEAYQYINHPTLRKRLIEISEAVLNNTRTVYEIFGTDTIKVRSCILLFASVSDIPVFKQILKKYSWN
jgi:uncharacterized protein (DUF1810 family)